MEKKIRKLYDLFLRLFRKACGNKKVEMKLFGIQLFLVAKPDKWHTNIFILYFPVLRIDTEPTKFEINFLLLTWFYKAIKYLFTKWNIVKEENELRISFCGMTIYAEKEIRPYTFPSALFHG